MSCLFSIVFIWFPSSAVGNQSGVDTWHHARIVACLLMNEIPPSYCSSLQAFMLNFELCNLLVERWYCSRDGTRRLSQKIAFGFKIFMWLLVNVAIRHRNLDL